MTVSYLPCLLPILIMPSVIFMVRKLVRNEKLMDTLISVFSGVFLFLLACTMLIYHIHPCLPNGLAVYGFMTGFVLSSLFWERNHDKEKKHE